MSDEAKSNEPKSFWQLIGSRIVQADEEGSVIELDADQRHMNTLRDLHGGVMMTMLDNAMAVAAHKKMQATMITTQMHTHFLKSSKFGKVYAYGKVIHHTNRTATVEGRLTNEAGELLAYATGSFLQVNKDKETVEKRWEQT